MIKVSIIIPVYNVEQYLEECLNSLISQTLKDIEIICVNDGSTDSSGKILEDFSKKDSRIKIINQKNSGVAIARNTGIDAANGECLMFVDSDDFLISTACEIAYNAIQKDYSDVCIFGHLELINDTLVEGRETQVLKKIINNPEGIDLYNFNFLCTDKIYKTSFLKNSNLKFIENLQTAEDTIFASSVFFYKPKCTFIEDNLYIYRVSRSGSATTYNIKGIESNLKSFKVFYETELFQQQANDIQLKVVELFLIGCRAYYRKFKTLKEQLIIAKDIDATLQFLETIYSKNDLRTLKLYNQLKRRRLIAFLNFIFSIENSEDRKYKIITVLGFRFTFLRGSK